MRRFLIPVLLMFFFVIESTFVELLPAEIFNSERILVPRFLMIALFFLTIYGSVKHGIIYALIFGGLFDIVYTEIIGIYLFLFPVMAYIVSRIMKVLHANIIIMTFVSLFGVALLELSVYGANLLINRTNIDFSMFTFLRWLPTLVLNLAFTIIAAFPLKKQFERFAEYLKD
ncbi:rod shape-determining protein MreD [Bacillus canaveralius]|uniref:Rod shape-determining protein MreD n=1 Tax=Bacillus canaveralius TaxID=1403243 RepID=A0A2N5GFS0_9BACI|nr:MULTISPECIES: rod shape-determining protein MreD [Bacillus]PLR79550.1 rod shape-determining protein MreD [Bacillus canaveralius]PLR86270.1 rod shape-determining protein MreD [Bacillus sp. V33-4]PLR89799.1 rod shape-determining protein MreD [Bacillus canaveralius]RSK52433.1 rod shape-determining protein MreD [Bacillus canaveralius]